MCRLAFPALACLGFGPVAGLAQEDDRPETSVAAVDSSVAIDSTSASGTSGRTLAAQARPGPQPEVEQSYAALPDQDVPRPHIAVHHTRLVGYV